MNQNLTMTSEARESDSTVVLGFWVYLMTDFVLFATLFATYAVLRSGTFGGPAGSAIFSGPFALTETVILLTSSFVCGLSLIAARAGSARGVLALLGLTWCLGAAFVGMEISEFMHLAMIGDGPSMSAFLSSYFTLVGTHGLHVTIGLVWMLMLIVALARRGLTQPMMRKLMLMSLFWHFLDIIWIFIFTIVYLMGLGII